MAKTIKFWQGMQRVVTIDGQDKLMIGKNSSGEAQYVNVEDLNQFLIITGDSIPAIQGGATPATAVDLPTGPSGQNRFFDASWGYWKYNNIVLKNPNGTDGIPKGNDGIVYWNGSTWIISKIQSLDASTTPIWIDKNYYAKEQVFYIGVIWEANTDTLSIDIPGNSNKWQPLDWRLTIRDLATNTITGDLVSNTAAEKGNLFIAKKTDSTRLATSDITAFNKIRMSQRNNLNIEGYYGK